MFNSVPEHLDGFYECLDACMDCVATRCSVSDAYAIIDSYYSDEAITDSQYKVLRDILKEVQK